MYNSNIFAEITDSFMLNLLSLLLTIGDATANCSLDFFIYLPCAKCDVIVVLFNSSYKMETFVNLYSYRVTFEPSFGCNSA